MMTIEEFHKDFMQEVLSRVGTNSTFYEESFTEIFCEFLVEQAVIEDFQTVCYSKPDAGMRLNAWYFNEETGVLTLIVGDYRHGADIESLTQTDLTKAFARVERFFIRAVDQALYTALDESTTEYEVAYELYRHARHFTKVQFIAISNADLSKRVKDNSFGTLTNYNCSYDVWDLGRRHRIALSANSREDIEIDLSTMLPGGVPCLPAFTGSENNQSYLAVFPGSVIASLYDEFSERLLEQNVRTFLQFRGKVNKGIRNTIVNEPEMFFAYNNGLSATADGVDVNPSTSRIEKIRNLQIVNGGQTTASLYTAMRNSKVDLSKVFVQVKLTVVESEMVELVVPRISEYANTQNKINAADFYSNHPYHLRIEEMSRRIWAPSPEQGMRETHWFYERARGQYANALARLSPAKAKELKVSNPKNQLITKTDLAKYENTFALKPHTVSLGAQKNFGAFAEELATRWTSNETCFNELYFRNAVARAIIFRKLDRAVLNAPWYGGYKANIVTYSIAKLVKSIFERELSIDYRRIWSSQTITPATLKQLLTIAEIVNERIQSPPAGVSNVTEWCKRVQCWNVIGSLEIESSSSFEAELVTLSSLEDEVKSAISTQKTDNGIHAQSYVFEKGADHWESFRDWAMENQVLSQKEESILAIACGIPRKIPTEKQCDILIAAEKRALEEGFYP